MSDQFSIDWSNNSRPFPMTDENISLAQLTSDFKDGRILLPPHQREWVWSDRQKADWIRRVAWDVPPVGVIVTYQIVRDGKAITPRYLNDGSQRTRTIREFIEFPQHYGMTTDQANELTRLIKVPVQHRHYTSNEQALQDFQGLNNGTGLTPMEFCAGFLVYSDGYELFWRDVLSRIQCVDIAAQTLVRFKQSRMLAHKRIRCNYALFYRFATGDKELRSYTGVGSSALPRKEDIQKKDVIEWKLRSLLETIGPDEANRKCKLFEELTARETASIQGVWDRVRTEHGDKAYPRNGYDISHIEPFAEFGEGETIVEPAGRNRARGAKPITEPELCANNGRGRGITETAYRWLLDVSIWKRNNGIPNNKWEDFLGKFFINTNGAGQVVDPRDSRSRVGLGVTRVDKLRPVCRILESDLVSPPVRKR